MATAMALTGQQLLERYRRRDGVDYRPWAPLPSANVAQAEPEPSPAWEAVTLPDHVKTYPTLNLAFYNEAAAVGRILYLLKALDQVTTGGGSVLELDQVRDILTDGASPWKVYTWRRLRQILNEGEGWAWHRDDEGRIWLHSPARIARALDTGRLQGRPVYVPTKGLLKGIKRVRAHFYASWESGRPEPAPVSRARLEQVTGVPKRTQRDYDALLERRSRTNIAITGSKWNDENRRRLAWEHAQHGSGRRPLMRFVDWTGEQFGEPGAAYIAYQVAATRTRCHAQAPKGRQKKHNQDITLVTTGTQGHDGEIVRIYHLSADRAAAAYGREPDHVHYWRQGDTLTPDASKASKLRGATLWGAIC